MCDLLYDWKKLEVDTVMQTEEDFGKWREFRS